MEIRSTVGNVEKCSGFEIKSVVIIIITENVIEIESPISSSHVGMGTSINIRMNTMPSANSTSPRKMPLEIFLALAIANPVPVAEVSDIRIKNG